MYKEWALLVSPFDVMINCVFTNLNTYCFARSCYKYIVLPGQYIVEGASSAFLLIFPSNHNREGFFCIGDKLTSISKKWIEIC